MTFKVQKRMCSSCIYRPDSPLSIEKLENDVRERVRGRPIDFFKGHRVCHHAPNRSGVCCRGFWDRHKDKFMLGQLAQRLGFVEFVEEDVLR